MATDMATGQSEGASSPLRLPLSKSVKLTTKMSLPDTYPYQAYLFTFCSELSVDLISYTIKLTVLINMLVLRNPHSF